MDAKQHGLDITSKTDLVGICYTMWFNAVLGSGDTPVTHANNVTELTEQYGWSDEYGFGNAQEQHNDLYAFHYWAEPAQGYYRSSDKAAHRRNLTLLQEAGVDFLVLDFTFVGGRTVHNKPFWDSHVEYSSIALLDTITEMRAEGLKTPYVVMWPNEVEAFEVFYDKFYGVEKWKDCFVYRDGKPFILHWNYKASETERFTTRGMYGLQGKVRTGQWSYLEADNSLTVSYDAEGNPEHVGVSVATQETYMSNTATAHGRQGGRFWNSQWQTAFAVHPKIVTLTWWNEWCAQLFCVGGKYVFTDNFNQEFSRDIEPMKGGHGDLYYRWLCEYIRAYKAHEACPRLVQE